ncbi:NPCBM/NEW2 domain-containing protein [Kribbella antibiotica]|uniref:NPCBM/NEW2 domain-containing protein n=1 Tax=Kribbella antibiotica TaxID=190195 RepID=UPI0014042A09|nr:NPCBM/NEW2 domain-containing protein [Kribbella antibiotica]
MAEKKEGSSRVKLITELVILAAAIAGLLTAYLTLRSKDDEGTAPPPGNSPSATVPSTPPPVTDPSESPPPSTTEPAAVQYLADLDALQGDTRQQQAELSDKGKRTQYLHSLKPPNPFVEYTFEFAITEGKYFCSTVGIDTKGSSGNVMAFQVYLDGKSVADYQTATNETRPVQVELTGHSQIKLFSSAVKREGTRPPAVWADARFADNCTQN